MADLEAFQTRANVFNKRYGVFFDAYEFVGSISSFDDEFIGGGASQENCDTFYRVAFMPLFKNAFNNYVDHKISSFDPWEMLRDFEENVIAPYRAECVVDGAPAPQPYGTWTKSMYLKRVQQELGAVNEDKMAYTRERYLRGELRLRSMRKYIDDLNGRNSTPPPEKIGTVIAYANAVNDAIESRTVGWFIRHPFKGFAERRDLKMLRAFIKAHTGDDNIALNENSSTAFNNAYSFITDDDIKKVKDSVSKPVTKPVTESPTTDNNLIIADDEDEDKEFVPLIEPIKKREEVKRPTRTQDFLNIGYRPDVDNLELEWKLVRPFYNDVKNGKLWKYSNPETDLAKVLLMQNVERLFKLRTQVNNDNGNLDGARRLLADMESRYSAFESSFVSNNPFYIAPDMPSGYTLSVEDVDPDEIYTYDIIGDDDGVGDFKDMRTLVQDDFSEESEIFENDEQKERLSVPTENENTHVSPPIKDDTENIIQKGLVQ